VSVRAGHVGLSAWSAARAAVTRVILYALLAALVVITLLPVLTLILASFKKDMELIQAGGFALPRVFQWVNYAQAWQKGHLGIYFMNTVIVTVAVVILGIGFAVFCAFSLVTLRVPLRRLWSFLFLIGIIFPEASIIIPSYFNLRALGLYNTYWALILPQTAMSIAFGAFFLQPALRNIPHDLIDCAQLDGCGNFTLLRRVIWPMLQPAVAALAVFFFLGTWNDFLVPSILVAKDELRTLPFGLLSYQQRYTSNVPLIAAGTMISAAPVIVFYLIFQRQVIQGITMGALKE
jgi:raffinose/stachyose/melibiose transport system permease protein